MTTISLDCTYYYYLDYILKATPSGVPPSPTSHVHIVTSLLCLRNGQELSSRSGTNPRYRSYSKVIPRSTYLINYPKVALPPNYAPMMLSKHMETHHHRQNIYEFYVLHNSSPCRMTSGTYTISSIEDNHLPRMMNTPITISTTPLYIIPI